MSIDTPRITPFLWFDDNAEAAVDFYSSIFPNARRLNEVRIEKEMKRPNGTSLAAGSIITIAFELDGAKFTAMNGGPGFPFTNAISLVVRCADQAEIDHYWNALTADGGKEVACGWLTDKFGLSWQVVPHNIGELIKHPAAFIAMMQMKKLIIADLENAGA